MEELFATQPSNAHQTLLLTNTVAWRDIAPGINRFSLLDNWIPVDFYLKTVNSQSAESPDICSVYLPGVLAFRQSLQLSLFPENVDGLEFLPIIVAGENWILLNCLKTVSEFDAARSQVMRGMDGIIFMVNTILVTDPAVRESDIFTLKDSNRSQLFAQGRLKDRWEKLGVKGINFVPIGRISLDSVLP